MDGSSPPCYRLILLTSYALSLRFVTFQSSDNVGHFTLEFSPAPLSMLEMQTDSMENNFLYNIELGERGVFFPTLVTMVAGV